MMPMVMVMMMMMSTMSTMTMMITMTVPMPMRRPIMIIIMIMILQLILKQTPNDSTTKSTQKTMILLMPEIIPRRTTSKRAPDATLTPGIVVFIRTNVSAIVPLVCRI